MAGGGACWIVDGPLVVKGKMVGFIMVGGGGGVLDWKMAGGGGAGCPCV